MRLHIFKMERWQSTWENRVEYNLSSSGVDPLVVSELLGGDDVEFLQQSLGYPQSNGTEELRRKIAAIYLAADPDNVLVTNGSSEANFVTMWSFLQRGAEIVVMLPNYMQIWGLGKTFQGKVKSFRLLELEGEWKPDISALRRAVGRKTKLIAVCNPNNPTGAVMHDDIIDEISDIAGKVGAWILSDEVYQGTELDGRTTPTFWGRYEKVMAINGLSKAYALPGLRIGWIVTTKDLASKLWMYHDYTTISPTALSDYLARKALEPETRAKIHTRTREIVQRNLPILRDWIDRNREIFSFVPPRAGAVAYVKYNLKINSTDFAKRLLTEKSTLIVPGDHFGMDGYIRIGYGTPKDYLTAGLTRIDELMGQLRQSRSN